MCLNVLFFFRSYLLVTILLIDEILWILNLSTISKNISIFIYSIPDTILSPLLLSLMLNGGIKEKKSSQEMLKMI